MKKGDYVNLTKVSDDVFGGRHPNQIFEGYSRAGTLQRDIQVGSFGYIIDFSGEYFITSEIIEVMDENTFKTVNSTYKINKVDPPEVFTELFGKDVQIYE